MTSITNNFHEFGQKHDQHALEKLMNSLDEAELLNLVKQELCSSKFTETWNYILKSFLDTSENHKKRLTLVVYLLKEFEERDIPQSRIETIMERLKLELPKFRSSDMARICSLCLEQIQSKKTIKFVWKDLLPELLNILVERETFTYDELDYSGTEYKSDFINTICMSSWSPSIVISLTTLFTDMPLNKEEHLKVVTKLGSYLEKLTPHEVPAFVYQLLRLCKQQNGRSIFLKLQNYFWTRIYNNSNVSSMEDSPDSMVLDLIETTDNTDSIEAESTVLYHIHIAASLGYECITEYLNSLKILVKAPEFVLQPFQLMVLFTISAIPRYEETVFEIIRPSIVRAYNEEQKKNHSSWFREMVPPSKQRQKPEDVLSQVIHFSVQDRDLVLSGLVNFAFVLLGIGSGLGSNLIAEKQWALGNTILLKIIKKKRQMSSTILQTLSNHIVTRQSVSQYLECLYLISRSMPLLMLENQSCIIELIDCLLQISRPIANQLLDALIPLIKVSPTIRDHLIIYLRKALYSRSVETRQMSVNGFLKLITNLKISNMAVLSQESMGSFSSGHSIFTQLSLNKTTQTTNSIGNFSNEALCFEILSILKRCFIQQAEIRTQLYDGLYDAVCVNPELGIPILDLIWFHFSKYIVMDEDHLPPISFDKLVVLKEAQMVLEEPFGKLIHTFGLITTKVLELDENSSTITKFTDILDSLSQRMCKCELVHFDLDDGTDLLDIVPESQKKMLVLKEAMCIYEALVGYNIYLWNTNSEKQGQIINSLFQGYNRLLHFSKTLSKPKKAESKRKKIDQTQQSQVKKDSKKVNKNFKLPDTVLNFQTVHKTLQLLHEPKLSWTTITEANVVKTNKELHQHVMQASFHLLQGVKRRKDLETATKKLYFDHITEVASILFKRIINRLEEFVDFDVPTAVLAMECFHFILTLINTQYKSNFRLFLNKVVSDEDPLTKIIETYEKIFENDEYELTDELETKKISLIALNTLQSLVNQIPTTDDSKISAHILEWLKNFAYNGNLTLKNSGSFINLFLEVHIKFKVSLTLLEEMSVSVGDTVGVITEEEEHTTKENFKIINEASVHNILLSLCNSLKLILEDIDALVVRLKSEYCILNFPGEDNCEKKIETLKSKERGVCCQLCFVVTIMTNLSNLIIPPGNYSEAIFRNIILLFGSLSSLTKYFSGRSTKTSLVVFQGAKFERLVKLAGKQLAPVIYKFILHLEEAQKESQDTQSKKKSVDASTLKSKVLKETRLIPKVIYEIEQFSKCVIQLSNKTKVNLSKYVGQGIVRDFRIVHLKETLDQDKEAEDGSISHDENDTSREDSRIEETAEEEIQETEATNESDASEEEEDSRPPSKRTKR